MAAAVQGHFLARFRSGFTGHALGIGDGKQISTCSVEEGGSCSRCKLQGVRSPSQVWTALRQAFELTRSQIPAFDQAEWQPWAACSDRSGCLGRDHFTFDSWLKPPSEHQDTPTNTAHALCGARRTDLAKRIYAWVRSVRHVIRKLVWACVDGPFEAVTWNVYSMKWILYSKSTRQAWFGEGFLREKARSLLYLPLSADSSQSEMVCACKVCSAGDDIAKCFTFCLEKNLTQRCANGLMASCRHLGHAQAQRW